MRLITMMMMSAVATILNLPSLAQAPDHDPAALLDRIEHLEQALETNRFENERVVATLRAELDAVRADDDRWLTERRADEIRGLVQDVLADADTRASLLQSGMTAGYDNGFFLGSTDGAFRLNLSGVFQTRYVANLRDGDDVDSTRTGFEVTRANLFFGGHIGDPRIGYLFVLASGASGDFNAESAWISYACDENLTVYAGRFRNRAFLREERISYTKQLTPERSYLNEEFTLDYVEGLWANWQNDQIRLQGVFHDGARSTQTAWNELTDFGAGWAVNGRLDWKLAGTWDEMESFTALGTEDVSSVIGAAVNYESKERGTPDPNDNYFSWTVDGSFESNGLSLYAAVVGRHSDNDGASDVDQYGFQTQVSYLFTEKLEPYLRYEYIDYDDNTAFDGSGAAADDLGLLTAGLNYYISGHSAKVTFDVMYAFDSVSISRPLVGLLADEDGEDGQVSIRAQFQLLF